jgi:SulP family sulfate permease
VIILRMRERDISSLTGLQWLERYAVQLRQTGNLLLLSDVTPASLHVLEQEGSVAIIGAENIFAGEPRLMGSTEKALAAAERWYTEQPMQPAPGEAG